MYICFWLILIICQKNKTPPVPDPDDNDPLAEEMRREQQQQLTIGEKLARLSNKDRLHYYNDLFSVKHGNQIELKSDQIIIIRKATTATIMDGQNSSSNNSDNISIEEDIEKGTNSTVVDAIIEEQHDEGEVKSIKI